MRLLKNVRQAPPAQQRQSNKKALALAAAITIAGLAAPASAQMVWTGDAGDGKWETASNWDPNFGVPPTLLDDALLNNGQTILINQPGQEANVFDVGTDYLGTITPGTGTLEMTGGTLTASAGIRFGTSDGGTGTLLMSGGAAEVIGGFNLFLFGDNGDSFGNEVSGGSITADGIGVAFQPTSTADLTISGADTVLTARNVVEIGLNRTNDPALPEQVMANGTVNMEDGLFQVIGGFGDFNVGTFGVGTLNLSGGTITTTNNMNIAFGGDISEGTVNHSGGDIDTFQMLIGRGGSGNYALSGTGTIDANETVVIGVFGDSDGTLTQSGDTRITTGGFLVGENGPGTYTVSGGTVNVTGVAINGGAFPAPEFGNMIVGRANTGTVTQTGGTVDVDTSVFLGDFDNSVGTYVHSGGTFTVGGNLNVGAALASNAPPDPEFPDGTNGAQGQALNTTGIFHVSGSNGAISVVGDLLANPADKGGARNDPGEENHATLIFETDSSGVTSLMVGGVADLDGAVIDIDDAGGYFAINDSLTLIDAAQGLSNGGAGWVLTQGTGEGFLLAEEDQGLYLLDVLSNGSGGEMLVASLIPEPTTAMAGLIGGVGLLLRRRRA